MNDAKRTRHNRRHVAGLMVGATLSLGVASLQLQAALAQTTAASQATQGSDNPQLVADVRKTLDGKRFRDVQVSVQHGVATLSGSTPTFADKLDAERRASKRKGIDSVTNNIQVAAGETDDQTIRQKLGERLVFDRVGYGTTTFNSFTLQVHNGIVTLGGIAYGPPDKDSAYALAANFPGVRDVINNIQVAPVSPNDDRIRLDTARAIYSYPAFSKYAINPGKPIRIVVINGKLILTGVVDSQADKDLAGLRASSVPGAFQVVNDLEVSGSASRESRSDGR